MKKRKYIILLLMGISVLGGCGGKDVSTQEQNTKEVVETSSNEREEAWIWIPSSGEVKSNSYGFSDGITWAITQNGSYLINTDGEAVYATGEYGPLSMDSYNAVQDGVTYYRTCVNNETAKNVYVDVIINKKGKEICRLVSGESEKYHILGYGDGKFLVAYIRTDKDNFGTYLYTIDKKGKKASDAVHVANLNSEYNDEYFTSAQYLGEGIFWLGKGESGQSYFNGGQNQYYYNARTKSVVQLAEGYYPLGKFYEKKLVFAGSGREYYLASSDDFEKNHYNLALNKKIPNIKDVDISAYINGYLFKTDFRENAVYNEKGERQDWLEPYRSYRDLTITPFEDGYTAVKFTGADSISYFTVLDGKGKELYSPIKISGNIGAEQAGYVQYYTEEGVRFIYPDGTVHKWDENLRQMKKLNFGAVGDGYLMLSLGETNYEAWGSGGSIYKFRSLKKADWNTFKVTKKTKQFETLDLKQTKGPKIGEVISQDSSIDDSLDKEIYGTVMFERDGVILQLINEKEIELINNNPENKIVDVAIRGLSYNGINREHEDNIFYTLSAQSGSIDRVDIGEDFSIYTKYMEGISSSLSEIPMETIGCQFSIRIGTSSEPEWHMKTVKLSAYNKNDMEALYGDKIGVFSVKDVENGPDVKVSAYRIKTDEGIAVIIRNDTDTDITIPGQPRWFINGQMQGKGVNIKYDFIAQNTALIYHFEEDADSVRKRMEIPNDIDVKMELKFSASTTSPFSGEMIEIPVGKAK